MADPAIDLDRLDKGELICLVEEMNSSGRLTTTVLAKARWQAASRRAIRIADAASAALRDYLAACDLEKQSRDAGKPTRKLEKTAQDKYLVMRRRETSRREADERENKFWKAYVTLVDEGAR